MTEVNPLDSLPVKVGSPSDVLAPAASASTVQSDQLSLSDELALNYKQLMDIYLPRVHILLNKKSNKGLRRVIKAIAEYPIIEDSYKRLEGDEAEIYNIIDKMLLSKYAIVMNVQLEYQAELERQRAENNANNNNVNEVENGG